MSIENQMNEVEMIEDREASLDLIPQNQPQPRTTVSVRFALGRSGGIHVVPQKAPENLPQARQGALRYAKAH